MTGLYRPVCMLTDFVCKAFPGQKPPCARPTSNCCAIRIVRGAELHVYPCGSIIDLGIDGCAYSRRSVGFGRQHIAHHGCSSTYSPQRSLAGELPGSTMEQHGSCMFLGFTGSCCTRPAVLPHLNVRLAPQRGCILHPCIPDLLEWRNVGKPSQSSSCVCAAPKFGNKPAIHLLHQCHDGERQVYLRPGDWSIKFSRHCGFGSATDPSETANHSRLGVDEPSNQGHSAEGLCCGSRGRQPANFQLGDEVEDEEFSDCATSRILEVDHTLKAGPGHSLHCVPLGYERKQQPFPCRDLMSPAHA